VPIVTGYEDTPGGHDALVLGAQLARLTGLGAIVATVYPSDGRGLAGAVYDDPRWLPRARRIALARFSRAREFIGTGWGHEEPEFIALGPGPVAGVLTDYADEVGAAVLVVGSTGHGLLGRITPGRTVQRLLPAYDKTRALLAQVPLLLLPIAVVWPSAWLARAAGLALLLAWGCMAWTLHGVRRRASRFLLTMESADVAARA